MAVGDFIYSTQEYSGFVDGYPLIKNSTVIGKVTAVDSGGHVTISYVPEFVMNTVLDTTERDTAITPCTLTLSQNATGSGLVNLYDANVRIFTTSQVFCSVTPKCYTASLATSRRSQPIACWAAPNHNSYEIRIESTLSQVER